MWLFGWGPEGSVKQEVFWKPSVRSQPGDLRSGREAASQAEPRGQRHQAFLEGRRGVVRWVAGNRGRCWGRNVFILCRDDRLLTPALQKRLGLVTALIPL